jgi:hypothetical protein
MGKQPTPDEHLSRAEQASRLPSFMAAGAPTSQNEQWARITNDPLLAIKQQEQEALKRVKHNPVKMQQILKEVRKGGCLMTVDGGWHFAHLRKSVATMVDALFAVLLLVAVGVTWCRRQHIDSSGARLAPPGSAYNKCWHLCFLSSLAPC